MRDDECAHKIDCDNCGCGEISELITQLVHERDEARAACERRQYEIADNVEQEMNAVIDKLTQDRDDARAKLAAAEIATQHAQADCESLLEERSFLHTELNRLEAEAKRLQDIIADAAGDAAFDD